MGSGVYALGYIGADRHLRLYLFASKAQRDKLVQELETEIEAVVTVRDGFTFNCMLREVQVDKRVIFLDGELAVQDKGTEACLRGDEFQKPGVYRMSFAERTAGRRHAARVRRSACKRT
jgi:hypothetical protein